MEDDVGANLGERQLNCMWVANVDEKGAVPIEQPRSVERQLHCMQRRLVPIQREERRGSIAVDLTTQFGSDRSSGTGHQHALSGDRQGDGGGVQGDRPSTQQVGQIEGAQIAKRRAPNEFGDGRQDHDIHADVVGAAAEVANEVCVCRRHSDREHLRVVFIGHLFQVRSRASDSHALHGQPLLEGVIIDDCDGEIGPSTVPDHGPDQLASTFTSAEDQDPPGVCGRIRIDPHGVSSAPRPYQQPKTQHGDEGESTGDDWDALGDQDRSGHPHREAERGRRRSHSFGEVDDLLEGTSQVPNRVGPKEKPESELQDDRDGRRDSQPPPVNRVEIQVVAQVRRTDECSGPQQAVNARPGQPEWVIGGGDALNRTCSSCSIGKPRLGSRTPPYQGPGQPPVA